MFVLALQDGLSLLHRAVRSGSPNLVRGILDWGAAHHYTWPISSGGPGGITPLHLAALLEDDGVVAMMLLDACDGSTAAFTDTRAADGVTPFHLAFQVGHYSLDRVLAGLGLTPVVTSVVEQQLQPSSRDQCRQQVGQWGFRRTEGTPHQLLGCLPLLPEHSAAAAVVHQGTLCWLWHQAALCGARRRARQPGSSSRLRAQPASCCCCSSTYCGRAEQHGR